MKAAAVKEMKTGLTNLSHGELVKLALRLSRFKKENKELLTYILFEAADEAGYVAQVKSQIDELFAGVNMKNLYLAKKTLRKILRVAAKYSRYSDVNETQADLLIHCAAGIKKLELNMRKSTALQNLYSALLKKIDKCIAELHEDVQYDYKKITEDLKI